MTLRFIIGRAGTGKTHTCLNEIRNALSEAPDGSPLIFLVPEQASFQMEYALATTPGMGGTVRAQVLSFRRLAFRVLAETGGAARVPIGELGKRMVLRKLLEQQKDNLSLFNFCADRPGFADLLARGIGEMKTYRVAPPQLGRINAKTGERQTLLQNKLADLELLYREMETYLSGRYTDPDDYLTFLADSLAGSSYIQGAEIWLDGFSGFTPQELYVLARLLKTAARVNIALCLDGDYLAKTPQEVGEEDLFYPTWKTSQEIRETAREAGVEEEPPLLLEDDTPPRFAQNALLAHLEKNYFLRPTVPFSTEEATTNEIAVSAESASTGTFGSGAGADNASDVTASEDAPAETLLTLPVRLVAAANRRAEVEAAAREIIRLCRDRGYRWRDISLVLRDLEPYHDLITTVFEDYGIPIFIDRKRPVLHHPVVELVRSALEVVIKDWAYDPVFRYLKTDLALITREETDLLENYVLAHGIRGPRWTDGQDWAYLRRYTLGEDSEVTPEEEEELARFNTIRRQASVALAEFVGALSEGDMKAEDETSGVPQSDATSETAAVPEAVEKPLTVRAITAALFALLEALNVPAKLSAWAEEAEKSGRLVAAREHRQVWSALLNLFDEMVESLDNEEIDLETYLAVLDAGLESLRLGLIPPGLDQVLVGSLDRSRNPNVRAVFVLGASDGILPARPAEDGLFSEQEREDLAELGLNLAPGGRRRVFEEQFLVYIALTRASEKLWVSYPLADDEGRAIAPSPVAARLKELLPGLEESVVQIAPIGLAQEDDEFIAHPGRALSYLVNCLRQWQKGQYLSPAWWDVYNWYAGDESRKSRASRVINGLFHKNSEAPLQPEVSRTLYGNPVRASVSRIEKFKSCPFAYFASYGLKLKDRPLYQLAAPDMGEFFHAALQIFVERLNKEGLDWGALSEGEIRHWTQQVVAELAPQLQSEILLSTARYRYLTGKLQKTVTRAALILGEHARRGIFRPAGLEISFGHGGELPPVVLNLPDTGTLELNGRIDRIDVARHEKGLFVRVIDYKSSDQNIDLGKVYLGLRLQLLTYLHVALLHCRRLCGEDGLPAGILYFTVKDPIIKSDGPKSPEEVAGALLKSLKMRGLLVADREVAQMMDSTWQSGYSELFPVALNKDGGFRAGSPVLTYQQFSALRRHLEEVCREAGRELLGGNVAISPYRYGNDVACRFCEQKPVCQFDLLFEDNNFRALPVLDKDAVWTALMNSGTGLKDATLQEAAPLVLERGQSGE